jgi:hypothetical protein
MDFPNVISPQASEMKLPVLAFAEQTEEEYLDASAPERDYATRITADRSALKDFLSRPVRIRQISWTNGSLCTKFNPWMDYIADARVTQKLNNFYNLRGTLCVKAVVNGGPFLYGRLMMAYRPLHLWDYVTDVDQSLVVTSQWPRIFIDPTTSLGGTIKCPFFYFKEYLRVNDADWDDMGLMYLIPMNELRSVASGVTSPAITVTIYAWMENVEMLSPTETVVPQCGEIEPQKGEFGDSKASISTVATNVAQAAGALKDVPTIGPYALATQTMAKGVASVAKAFGYSAPLNLDRQVNTVKVDPKGATTNMQVPTAKMAVDIKQELTIDPQIAGVNFGDELSILSIAQRETYLDTFNWMSSSVPESNLYSMLVLPSYCNLVSWYYPDDDTYAAAIPTAIGFASMPFEYWSGSIKFRFQIVSSNFHKGRLAIVYDPAGDSLTGIGENMRFTEIIDISKTRDFTMTIDNNQQRSLLSVPPYPSTSQTYFTSNGTIPLSRVTGDNGALSVYVLNELQASSTVVSELTPAVVQINVFVSAGDNFQLFAPTDCQIAKYALCVADGVPTPDVVPQAGTLNESLAGDVNFIEETTAPVNAGGAQVELVPSNSGSSALTSVYIGETITSFRQLLHRQMYHHSCYEDMIRGRVYSRSMSFFPCHRGCVPGATRDVDNIYYNYSANTIFNYLAPAFIGMRGGMRWKVVKPKNDSVALYANRLSVYQYSGYEYAWQASAYTDDRFPHGCFELQGINSGNTFTTGSTDTVLDIELPYYSNNKFFPCRWLDYTSADFYQRVNGWRIHMDGTDIPDYATPVLSRFYTEVAEDFTFLFFLNAPPVIMNLVLPRTQGD